MKGFIWWERPFLRLQINIYSDFIVSVNLSEAKSTLLTLLKVFGVWSIECYDTIMVPSIIFWTVECAVAPTSLLLVWTLWVCMWMWIYQASLACALYSGLEWEWIEDALHSSHWLCLFLIHSPTYIRLHPPLLVFPFIYFSVEALLNKVFRFCEHGMHHPILFCAKKPREHVNCQIKKPSYLHIYEELRITFFILFIFHISHQTFQWRLY